MLAKAKMKRKMESEKRAESEVGVVVGVAMVMVCHMTRSVRVVLVTRALHRRTRRKRGRHGGRQPERDDGRWPRERRGRRRQVLEGGEGG